MNQTVLAVHMKLIGNYDCEQMLAYQFIIILTNNQAALAMHSRSTCICKQM